MFRFVALVLFLAAASSTLAQSRTYFGDSAAAASPHIDGGDALRKFLVGTTWSWEPDGMSRSEVTFFPDGTVHHNAFLAKFMVRSKDEVDLQLGEHNVAKWKFDSSYSHYSGTDFGGGRRLHGERVVKAPDVPPAAPTPVPSTDNAARTRIAALIDQKVTLSDKIFGALTNEPVTTVRSALVELRESLLDESAKFPTAVPEAYKLGVRYCDGLVSACDERDKLSARMNGGSTATTNGNVAQWRSRAAELRGPLDILWTDFRAAARQPFTGKPRQP